MKRRIWTESLAYAVATVALVGIAGSASAADLNVQGAMTADQLIAIDSGAVRTFDLGQGGSKLSDGGDLRIATDDLLYVDADTTSFSGRVDVTGDLVANYPIYANGNLVKFGGGAATVLDFNRDGSRIWSDNGSLQASSAGNLYVTAPILSLSRDLDVTRDATVQRDLTVRSNADFTSADGSASDPDIAVAGYADFNGTVDFSNATTIGLNSDSSSTSSAAFTVGTDLTVTSGARIGTGSTPNDLTALADDTLFVEGAAEFDGALYVDGATDLDSTLDVAGVLTTGTNVTSSIGGAEKFIIQADSAPTDDMLTVSNTGYARTGTSGSAIQVNFVQGEITGSDTHSAVLIGASTTSTDDTLYGLEIDAMSGTAGIQTAFMIDSGWDTDIEFTDSSAVMMIPNAGSLSITEEDLGTTLLTIQDAGDVPIVTPGTADAGSLGGTSGEWGNVYVGDNGGLNLGADQDALLKYDNATDARTELTGTGASLYIEDKLSLGRQTLTMVTAGVASEVLTPTATYVEVTGQSDATDDVSISTTGAKEGQLLIITNLDATAVLVNAEATTKISGGTDVSLSQYDVMMLIFDGTNWLQVGAVTANS